MCVRAKSLRRAEGKRESMKPVIGIIAACTREVHPAYTTGHDYVRAVERAGGLALLLPATPDAVSAGMAQWLALCGGFVLPGGGDVAPTYYGQSPCCFSKRMRKFFRKNEKSMLQFCNKNSKKKRAFTMG